MLKVENLTVSIQNKIVVKNANFHIPTGETHVLFGLNGSGKTSLLQAIMGNPKFKIEEGRIIFKGTNPDRVGSVSCPQGRPQATHKDIETRRL